MTFNFPCRRGNYTRHLDKVLEEAAAEFYPGVKFMRVSGFCSVYNISLASSQVECLKYPGFCITRQKKYPGFLLRLKLNYTIKCRRRLGMTKRSLLMIVLSHEE
ncbi:unnamed protein product, partial [Linum tenue]